MREWLYCTIVQDWFKGSFTCPNGKRFNLSLFSHHRKFDSIHNSTWPASNWWCDPGNISKFFEIGHSVDSIQVYSLIAVKITRLLVFPDKKKTPDYVSLVTRGMFGCCFFKPSLQVLWWTEQSLDRAFLLNLGNLHDLAGLSCFRGG